MNLIISLVAACAAAILWVSASSMGTPQDAAPQVAAPVSTESALMKPLAGDFTADMWMKMDAASEPMKTTGTCSTRLQVPGNFWLISDFNSSMMGEPFSGHSIMGYDMIKKKWVNSWVDSMAPIIMHSEGDWDAKTKSWSLVWDSIDPMTNKPSKFRMVTTVKDHDHHDFAMFVVTPEGEYQNMGISYTRKK